MAPGRDRMPDGRGPTTIRSMRTEWIAVADGVELAADVWTPAGAAGPQVEAAGSQADAAPTDTPAGAAGSQAGAAGSQAGAAPTDPPAGAAIAPFVLVHGLASNARMWDGVADALVASGHPAVTVDLRGHGRSSKPDGPYDVPTVADDVAALIAALGLDRPVVAGQSWGGNVVLELAARHPDATRGIVCVDGGWLEPSRQFADWDACLAALAPPRLVGRRLDEVEGYVRSAHPDWPESGIRGVLANFEVRPDGTVAPWLTYERHLAVLRGLWEHHPSERYAGLAVPVLLAPADGDDDGVDAAEAPRSRDGGRRASRTPGSAGSPATTTPRAASGRARRRHVDAGRGGLLRVSGPRILAIMGSGETAPTMAKVHRALFERLDAGGAAGGAAGRSAAGAPGRRPCRRRSSTRRTASRRTPTS